jgi:hypothetical protein
VTQGFTRFRKIQVGKQSVIGTAVAATRVLPYRSAIVLNPNRTDPDVDVGLARSDHRPLRRRAGSDDVGRDRAADVQRPRHPPLGRHQGRRVPTGNSAAGYTWTYTAASLTADSFDYYSVQTGDDTADSGGSGINGFGGVINTLGDDDARGPRPVDRVRRLGLLGCRLRQPDGRAHGRLVARSSCSAPTPRSTSTASPARSAPPGSPTPSAAPADRQQQPRPQALRERLEHPLQPRRLRPRAADDRVPDRREDRGDDRRGDHPRRHPDPQPLHQDRDQLDRERGLGRHQGQAPSSSCRSGCTRSPRARSAATRTTPSPTTASTTRP